MFDKMLLIETLANKTAKDDGWKYASRSYFQSAETAVNIFFPAVQALEKSIIECEEALSKITEILNIKSSTAKRKSIADTIKKIISNLQYSDNVVLDHYSISGPELGFDSLDKVEILMSLEEEFDIEDIYDDVAESCETVADLIDLIFLLKG